MEYYGIIRKQKLLVKFIVIILGIYIIYNSIINKNWIYFPIGFLMIFATFFNKKHIISDKGIDILYTICGFEFHNIWNYREIDIVYKNSEKSKPNIELHIGKNLIYRKFILSADDALKSLDIISRMNPKIVIKEINIKNK